MKQRRRRRRRSGGQQQPDGQPAHVDHRKGHRSELRTGVPGDRGGRQPWRRRSAPAEHPATRRIPGGERAGPRFWVEDDD